MKIELNDNAGVRIDVWLAEQTTHTRSHIKNLIKNGDITVNDNKVSFSYKLKKGDIVDIIEQEQEKEKKLIPQDIPLDILYEDQDIVVINKQPNIIVHPAPGHPDNTIVNAIMYHCKDFDPASFEESHRPGIVHRLDKDTSGILLVARNMNALTFLKEQFKSRTTRKEYLAIVKGIVAPMCGRIETQIGRSRSNRKKMTINPESGGREAITNYKLETQYKHNALVRFHIETGRTHQIRLHTSSIGHPVIGDIVYGHRNTTVDNYHIPRQMLHAAHLEINHPTTNERMTFTAQLPTDMLEVLDLINKDSRP
jgi:23S rRNA pseudouridine1911/1915/1917 synthase